MAHCFHAAVLLCADGRGHRALQSEVWIYVVCSALHARLGTLHLVTGSAAVWTSCNLSAQGNLKPWNTQKPAESVA
jgi:hypothetical protein